MKVLGGKFLNETDLRDAGIKSVGRNVMVHETVQLVDLENIELGSNIRIDPYCVVSAAGGFVRMQGYNHLGSHACLFGAAGITLEQFAGLSGGVLIYSASDDYSGRGLTNPTVPHDFLKVTRRSVSIGRHAIVGAGTTILPGANIGEGAAVGALALVTKPLAAWGIYAGNPAKFLKARKMDLLEVEQQMMARATAAH